MPVLLLLLFTLLPLRAASLPATTLPSDANAKAFPAWTEACRTRVAEAKGQASAIDTVFLGDSLTVQWLDASGGKAFWDRLYAGHALNFGTTGDGTEHLLWRLSAPDKALDLSPFTPSIRNVVLLIGTYDTAAGTEAVLSGIDAVLARTKALFPQARIFLTGLPRNARADAVTEEANAALRTRADGKTVCYVDLPGAMTPEGQGWKGLAADRLHLAPEGYALWADLLTAALAAK